MSMSLQQVQQEASAGEKMMVCVHEDSDGELLIKRSTRLAQLFHCSLQVLLLLPNHGEENSLQQHQIVHTWRARCKEANAELIVRSNSGRKPCELIIDVAQQEEVTQLIIGQCGQSRWQEMIHGSFANELLRLAGDIDLHIVAVQQPNQG